MGSQTDLPRICRKTKSGKIICKVDLEQLEKNDGVANASVDGVNLQIKQVSSAKNMKVC